ncbi:MAG TPA: hypothetical protein VFM96_07475 [Gaiellaceae bacterium]|nr:hypothetical protein [Gaiellaceae bacterium]
MTACVAAYIAFSMAGMARVARDLVVTEMLGALVRRLLPARSDR